MAGIFLVSILIVGLVMKMIPSQPKPTTPTQPPPPHTPLSVTGWIPYWDQEQAFSSFEKNPQIFDYVGFFWYHITEEGTVAPYTNAVIDHRMIEIVHDNNTKAIALIANLVDEEGVEEWDPERVSQVISDESAREQHIQDIVDLVVFNNFDGLALDYEFLRPEMRDDYSIFVEELSESLHAQGKELSVAIHPKTSDDPSQFEGARAQDYIRLANAADHLHFMMYTEHGTHSQPGPSSTIEYTQDVIRYALDELNIPPQKIIIGIGLFGSHWQVGENNRFQGTTSDLTYQQISSDLQNMDGARIIRDENTKSMEVMYEQDERIHVVWFDDTQGVQRRMDVARELGVGGVAFWRLGGEDTSIWNSIQ